MGFFLLGDHWIWLISSVTWYLEAWYKILEACLHKNTILTSSTMSTSPLPSAYASLEEGGKKWKCWSKAASALYTALMQWNIHPGSAGGSRRHSRNLCYGETMCSGISNGPLKADLKLLFFSSNPINQNDKQRIFPTRHKINWNMKKGRSFCLFIPL